SHLQPRRGDGAEGVRGPEATPAPRGRPLGLRPARRAASSPQALVARRERRGTRRAAGGLRPAMTATGAVALWRGDESGPEGWRAGAAPGSRAALSVERGPIGAALRFDFALSGHGAWAIARRELPFELPAHFVFSLVLRGEATPAGLQLKLVDPGGAN